MPVTPTYPGVYIEEIPSGVHTITGVATSITAFVGYTGRGPANTPVHIFSYADFERAFGGLSVDSPLSYCVRDFFQNGGTEAYIVRVAKGAATASVVAEDTTSTARTTISAASDGTWGNNLQVDVDYDTSNPQSLFNVSITSYTIQGGKLVQAGSETFRNLSVYEMSPSFADAIVNAGSKLVSLATNSLPLAVVTPGYSQSASIPASTFTPTAGVYPLTGTTLRIVLDGEGPFDVVNLPQMTSVADVVTKLQGAIDPVLPSPGATVTNPTGQILKIASKDAGPGSSVQILDAPPNNAAGLLQLGLAHGGTEVTGAAPYRPQQTGTVGKQAPGIPFTANAKGTISIDIYHGSDATQTGSTIDLMIWDGSAVPPSPPNSAAQLVTMMQAALTAAMISEPRLSGVSVSVIGGVLRIVPGPADPNLSFDIVNANGGADTTAQEMGLTSGVGAVRNVAHYAPGAGLTARFQSQGAAGNDGTPPDASTSSVLTGDPAGKTGIYALENVDLFNLLVMPDATAKSGMYDVLTAAIAYCEQRRAMIIIDAPEVVAAFSDAQTWIGGSDASSLRSRNSALYFPRLREVDPLMSGVVNTFPAAGAIAGIYARTDGTRGVWKAPAGIAATFTGVTGLSYTLTNAENGTLNPLALNCLRTFPVTGTVAWGARTGVGADVLADDYEYVPVRRLALYLEESLYRGTQWVVFEPNDEPLWAQIRLNVGAFMHELFAQGAFQGTTPKDAYFVKCDNETTTQNDIDLGRVNIVVGFAPLRPAEFVIIQIQQIVPSIQT